MIPRSFPILFPFPHSLSIRRLFTSQTYASRHQYSRQRRLVCPRSKQVHHPHHGGDVVFPCPVGPTFLFANAISQCQHLRSPHCVRHDIVRSRVVVELTIKPLLHFSASFHMHCCLGPTSLRAGFCFRKSDLNGATRLHRVASMLTKLCTSCCRRILISSNFALFVSHPFFFGDNTLKVEDARYPVKNKTTRRVMNATEQNLKSTVMAVKPPISCRT